MSVPVPDPLPLPPELAIRSEPFGVAELDEALASPSSPAAERVNHWMITDDDEAEWAARKAVLFAREISEVKAHHQEWVRQVDEWLAKRTEPIRKRYRFFAQHLEQYALRMREQSNGEVLRVTLPSGHVQTTKVPDTVDIADADTVLAWARVHAPSAIKVTEEVQVSALRKVTRVVEVPIAVRLGCGDTYRPPTGVNIGLGESGVLCPTCGATTWCASIDESRLEVRDQDGLPVPGTRVKEGRISPKLSI